MSQQRSGGKGSYQPRIKRLQREEKRSHPLYYLAIFDALDGTQLGVLGDLSPKGLLLIGTRSFPSGQQLRLRIQGDPGSEITGDVDLILPAEARWSAPDANPAYTATGMRFLEQDPATRSTVQDLVHRLGLVSDDEADGF